MLELIPSEIARRLVPLVPRRGELAAFDAASRAAGGQRDARELVRRAVDERLARSLPGYSELLPMLEGARARLVARRMRG